MFFKILSDDCQITYLPKLHFPKSETLSNGYIIIITNTGIYSIDSLSNNYKINLSYNFTEEQKLTINNEEKEIYQAQISQFQNENEGKDYVLCLVKNFLYILTNKGKFLFYKNLDITFEKEDSVSLISYDYNNKFYNFFILYVTKKDKKCYDIINYYKLNIINKNKGEINLYYNNSIDPPKNSSYSFSLGGISCKIMTIQESETSKNVLVCFIAIIFSDFQQNILAIVINPVSMEIINSGEISGHMIKYISASVGEDKSKAIVCYIDEGGTSTCFYYNLNEKKFIAIFSKITCSFNEFALNTYYFPKNKEFIFSCINFSSNLVIKKINNNFELINEAYPEINSLKGCYNLYSYSIIYLLNNNQYITIIEAKCSNEKYIRFFKLLNNCSDSNIIIKEGNEEENESLNKEEDLKIISDTLFIFNKLNKSEQINITDKEKNINDSETLKSEILEESSDDKENSNLKKSEKIESSEIIKKESNYNEIVSDSNSEILEKLLTYSDKENKEKIESDYNSNSSEKIYFNFNTNLIDNSKTNLYTNITENLKTDSSIDILEKFTSNSISDFTEEYEKKSEYYTNNEMTGQLTSDFNSKETEKNSIEKFQPTNFLKTEKITEYNINTEIIESEKEILISSIIISGNCLCNENLPYILIPSKICTNYCSIDQLLNKTCKIDCVFGKSFESIVQNVETIINKENFSDENEIIIIGNKYYF